ncbi:hypothetical protein NECID01_0036 [Nematocida sp. AWRm77]|nr:hypothetical protein NECID01_0036 [Nematocida sp. AWRm77]
MFLKKIVPSVVFAFSTYTWATDSTANTSEAVPPITPEDSADGLNVIGLKYASMSRGEIPTLSGEKKKSTSEKEENKPAGDKKKDGETKDAAHSASADLAAQGGQLSIKFILLMETIKRFKDSELKEKYSKDSMPAFVKSGKESSGPMELEIKKVGAKDPTKDHELIATLSGYNRELFNACMQDQKENGSGTEITMKVPLSKKDIDTLLEKSEKAGPDEKWVFSINNLKVPTFIEGMSSSSEVISKKSTTLYTDPILHTTLVKDLVETEEKSWLIQNWVWITVISLIVAAVAIFLAYFFGKKRNN